MNSSTKNDNDNDNAIQVELTISAWQSALTQLATLSELSEEQIVDAANKGALWRKKSGMHKLRRVRILGDAIGLGDQLYLNYRADVLAQEPLKPQLVSNEKNYSIWNKPSGMLSQGSKWSDHCTITETVRHELGKPTFLVHRLDKAASGLIVVAHTKNALKKLTTMFAEREVEKHYRVRAHGKFSEKLPFRIEETVENKPAITDVLEAKYIEGTDTSELVVSILTGRKHQIRAHLHGMNLPVIGDRLFDAGRAHTCDLQLMACRLGFNCPFTKAHRVFELQNC